MPLPDYFRKWKFENGCEAYKGMSSKCAAALAAHPDVAPMVPPFEGDPKECAFKPKVSDEDYWAERSKGLEVERNQLVEELGNERERSKSWRDRAEWLLERMSGGQS
jgi:hypothetical protein